MSATVSYSGPFTRPLPSTSTSRPQVTGQWMQLVFTPTSPLSSMYSPEILMASANDPFWKFRVGRMLRAFVVLTIPAVPKRFMLSPRTGCSLKVSRTSFVYCLNFSGSSMSSLREPVTLTAFSRFEPITAPTPVRPAIRSFETMPA